MKKHGKKYNAAAEKIEAGRKYNLEEAVAQHAVAHRTQAYPGHLDRHRPGLVDQPNVATAVIPVDIVGNCVAPEDRAKSGMEVDSNPGDRNRLERIWLPGVVSAAEKHRAEELEGGLQE